jgi:hypothetical protein
MKRHSLKTLSLFLTALLVIMACEIPSIVQPAAPKPAAASIETIVFKTAAAAQTQTALLLPSPTSTSTPLPLPTATSTETPTPTATVIFILPTATKPFEPYSAGSNCEAVSVTPYNPVMAPHTNVEITWTLKNTGDEIWGTENFDFKYTNGTDMHRTDAFDLPHSVIPDNTVTITVPMGSPDDPGTYTTNWVLGSKKETLCKVSATIIVK